MTKNKKKSSKALVVVGRVEALASRSRPVQPNRPRSSRKRDSGPLSNPSARQFATSYLATLNDPFEYGPVKLGYDCLVNTNTFTAYIRTSFTVNADGTFAVVGFPNPGNGLLTSFAGASVATYNPVAYYNINSLTSNGSEARIVSGGIRLFCPQAATSAPGMLFAGTMPSVTLSNITTSCTPSFLRSLPQSEMTIGTTGAAALMRPQDNDSFVFQSMLCNSTGQTNTSAPVMSVPYVTGSGFPAGQVVWVEAIINLELLPNSIGGAYVTNESITNTPNPEPVAADFFPSPERLIAAIRPLISDAAVLDGLVSAAGAVHPMLGSATNTIRSLFSHGRHSTRVRSAPSAPDSRSGTSMAEFQSSDTSRTVRGLAEGKLNEYRRHDEL